MSDLAAMIDEANQVFERMAQERHDMGSAKYGPLKFLGANTVEEAMFELIDLSNYARYTFIKLYLMNDALDKKLSGMGVDIGPDSIISTRPAVGKE